MLITTNLSSNFAAGLYDDISVLAAGRSRQASRYRHETRPVKNRATSARAHQRPTQHVAAQRQAAAKDTTIKAL
jgi:hypothetical protein